MLGLVLVQRRRQQVTPRRIGLGPDVLPFQVQHIIDDDAGRMAFQQGLARALAAQALLQVIEGAVIVAAPDDQFAVEHGGKVQVFQSIWKRCTDLVAGPREDGAPGRPIDQLDADTVVFPLRGIGFRCDQAVVLLLQCVGQHDRREGQVFVHGGDIRPPLQPGEQVLIGRAQAVPYSLDGFDRLVAILGQDLL